jgi:tRNA threonylcarbamoyl adenosine modification protein YeaZ
MLILGLETATDKASLALVEGEVALAQRVLDARGELVRHLIPALDEALRDVGRGFDEVGLIAVGRGPGSFTGARIGVATGKALAQARDLPIVGVSTLEACAWSMKALSGGVLCPVLRSRRDSVYAAIYRGRENLTGDLHLRAAELADRLNPLGEPVLMGGHARGLWDELFAGRFRVEVGLAPEEALMPSAEAVARLGAERLAAHGADDALTLAPVYLRPPGVTLPKEKRLRPGRGDDG